MEFLTIFKYWLLEAYSQFTVEVEANIVSELFQFQKSITYI